MADPNVTLTGCSGTKYRFGPVPFARHLRILGLDKAILLLTPFRNFVTHPPPPPIDNINLRTYAVGKEHAKLRT